MPFATEELWRVTAETGPKRQGLLVLAAWPQHQGLDDEAAEAEIGWVIDVITSVRSVRAEMNVPAASQVPLALVTGNDEIMSRAKAWGDFIKRLARISTIDFPSAVPPQSVQVVVRGDLIALPLAGVVDLAAERTRLQKEIAKVTADIARIDAKLANADFLARAPEEVVEGEREKREEADGRRAKIGEALTRLGGAAT
jgi:valyl-tRNA synthetase